MDRYKAALAAHLRCVAVDILSLVRASNPWRVHHRRRALGHLKGNRLGQFAGTECALGLQRVRQGGLVLINLILRGRKVY